MHFGLCFILVLSIQSLQAKFLPSSPSLSRFGTSFSKMASGKFEQRKEAVLDAISCGADRSKKGSFDAPIADMLCHLNESQDWVSTSSCSGRVVLFWESTASDADLQSEETDTDTASVLGTRRKAKGGQWLLCKHGEVTLDEVESALGQASSEPGIVFFKHEPFVLHVQCRSVDAACQLMEVARAAGFRESGISIGKKHIIVGVRTSALKIEAPVHENGQMLVTRGYLEVLVRLANEKFSKNRERTDRLYALMKQSILRNVKVPEDGSTPTDDSASLGTRPGSPGIASGPWAITCLPAQCEAIRGLLLGSGWLDKTYRNLKLGSGRMAIPVTREGAALLQARAQPGHGDVAGDGQPGVALGGEQQQELCARLQAAGDLGLEVVAELPAAGKTGKSSPAQRLVEAMAGLLSKAGVGGSEAEAALRGVPKKWEGYGDLVLLPEGSLQGGPWERVEQAELWGAAAAALGAERVAAKEEIDAGAMRESRVRLRHPAGGSGWVSVVQHGLTYRFDVTRVMFSRGNVNERRRMGLVDAAGETVVDLFAGIGYFSVPLLATGKAAALYACEWNPASVEALRENMKGNGVADRCTVLEGDNRESAPQLQGLADRVLLGLLPSSEGAWGIAVRCLKDGGGWLHVHENVAEADMEAWKARLRRDLGAEAAAAGREWSVEIRHVEFVKTYAPRVWHVVVDVECRVKQ